MKKIILIVVVVILILVGGIEIYLTLQKPNMNSANTSQNMDNKEEMYIFKDGDREIVLGEEFSKDKLGSEQSYSEIASCAFDGLDKTYTYSNYEITTFPDGEKDRIYSIYFLNVDVTTTEGVKISDIKEKMISTYGEEYKTQGNQYTYTKGKTNIEFIVENDVITSIQYTYITEN